MHSMGYIDTEDDGFVLVGSHFELRLPDERTPTKQPSDDEVLVTVNKSLDGSMDIGELALRDQSLKISNYPTSGRSSIDSCVAEATYTPWVGEEMQVPETSLPSDSRFTITKKDIPRTPKEFCWIYQADAQYNLLDPRLSFQVEGAKKRNRIRNQCNPRTNAPSLGNIEYLYLSPQSSDNNPSPTFSRLDTKPPRPWISCSASIELKYFFAHPDRTQVTARQFADPKHNTALHIAASEGCYDAVAYLLMWAPELGQDFVDARNAHGETPLELAIFRGHADIVRLLIEYGADWGVGDEPLILACRDAGTIKVLVDDGAPVNAAGKRIETVLHRLCGEWPVCEEAVERLITLKLGINVDAKNWKGQTAYECLRDSVKRSRAGHLLWNDMSYESRRGLKGPSEISVWPVVFNELPFMFVSFLAGRR